MVSTPLKFAGKGVAYIVLTAAGVVVEKYASKKLEEFNQYATEHGGYEKVAKNNIRAVEIKTRRAAHHAKRCLDETLEPVIDEVKKTGKEVHESFSNVLYGYIPRKEELESGGKYEGVGTNFKGPILTRSRCESCLEFLSHANETIPEDQPLKQTVVNDIRRSASNNTKELEGFYQDVFSWQFSDINKIRALMDCVDLANDYLKEPASTLSGEKYS
ncbi:Uncharacterised protein [uncultured archaeon]|nr:Uncharacterised protein [uncultured archaeon]